MFTLFIHWMHYLCYCTSVVVYVYYLLYGVGIGIHNVCIHKYNAFRACVNVREITMCVNMVMRA